MHCSWSVARGHFSSPGEHVRAFSDDRAPSFHDLYVGVRSQCYSTRWVWFSPFFAAISWKVILLKFCEMTAYLVIEAAGI